MNRMLELITAARRFRQRPLAALLALASLALATAAVICVTTVGHGVLLKQLPYRDAERLVHIAELDPTGHAMPVAGPNFDDLAARHGGFERLAYYGGGEVAVSSGERVVRTGAYGVSSGFLRVLGVEPVRGRGFPAAGKEPAAVALVSERLLPTLFGDQPAEGRRLRVYGQEFDVIGVMPEAFAYPAGAGIWVAAEVWPDSGSRTAHNWEVVGKLKPGVDLERARADARAIGAAIRAEHGEGQVDLAAFGVEPLRDHLARGVRTGLLALLAAAAVLFLAATSNVANLLLARHLGRRGELAVRAALGASAGRLRREALWEGLLLGVVAAALGTLLARVGIDVLVALAGTQLPRADAIGLSLPSLLTGWALALIAAGGAALAPFLRAGAASAGALADSSRVSAGTAQVRARRMLLVGQMAFATMLLIAVSLLTRSFFGLLGTEPGFAPDGAVAVALAVPEDGEPARVADIHRRLTEQVAMAPGVSAAGTVNALPMTGWGANGQFRHADDSARTGYAEYRVAGPGYFAAMGMPLLLGRDFSAHDDAAAPHVAVVSARLAAQAWPGESPLGKRLLFGNMDGDDTPITVVGVVGDVAERGLDRGSAATVYVPVAQRPQVASEFALVVRGPAPPAALATAVQAEVDRLLPGVPARVRPLASLIEDSLAFRRFVLVLFAALAGLAATLALAGVSSLTVYLVGERRREFAIRLSLGAPPARVHRLVLFDGWKPQALGIAIGIGASLAGSRWLGSLLHGVGALDPLSFAAAALLLSAAALLACWWPARRVQRIEPMAALRYE